MVAAFVGSQIRPLLPDPEIRSARNAQSCAKYAPSAFTDEVNCIVDNEKTKGSTCWRSQPSRLRHHVKRSKPVGSRILHRNRRWIRGKTLFKQTRQKEVHASYQWELSGPNGGDWWLSVNDGTYKMGRGKD
jgi:Ni/Co efflux regulator RcnB